MTDQVSPELCQEIRRTREQVVGISQEEAARRLGISLKAYRAYESFREPKLARLRQLAAAFGLEEDYFIREATQTHRELPSEFLDEIASQHEEVVRRLDAQDEVLRTLTIEIAALRNQLDADRTA